MSSIWTIGGETVLCRSVELGLAQTDTAEVEILDGSTSITDGSWVALRCDSVPVLYGRASVGETADGKVSIILRGPWELLEATTYQQYAKMAVAHAVDETHPYGYALSNILTPEVQLGMDDDGDARTTLQEAQAILAYAISAIGVGVSLSFDPAFTGLPMQPVNISGSNCAACLLTIMRFHPDVLLYFDYSGSGAVLKAVPVATPEPITFPGSGGVRVVDARFRQKLNYKPSGIRILYTRTTPDGRIEAHTDTGGAIGTDGKGPYVINWPVRLEGATPPPLLSQRIRTRPIPHSDNPDEPEEDETELKTNWWQTRLRWLRLPGVAEITTISDHLVTVDPPEVTESEDDSEEIPTTWSVDPDDYPRELVDGTIPPWLPKVAAPLTISATFKLGDTSGLLDATKEKLKKIFGDTLTDAEIPGEAQVTGTDANTREYAALSSWPSPPDWPAGGIASSYMAAFDSAVWEGNLTLTGAQQPLVPLGTRVNVSGFASAWSSMAAVVRNVSYSPVAHQTSIGCDAPDNFGFGDFYELQLTMRKAAGTDARTAALRRTQAIPADGGRVQGGGMSANRSSGTTAKGGGSTAGTLVPWACDRASAMELRVWPAAMWDGQGNHFQPVIGLTETVPEQYYDFTLTSESGDGALYVECTVDDSDDLHGIITAASLKLDYDDHDWFERSGSTVLIPICTVTAAEDAFTFTPLRAYVLCLRRYGPPGSTAWDVTPL
ncbi:MAG: hypothetical protein JWM59_1537 [Verrucomicrobiales bacterium]|nr:hypothetical protein [Verrucomicrobiales bacterium]